LAVNDNAGKLANVNGRVTSGTLQPKGDDAKRQLPRNSPR
jgi:hypothetical protein